MRVFSVFSGVGGLDMGLERAGHELVALCEIDPVCRSILARHWPDVPMFTDIKEVDGDLTGLGPVDLVAGGSPCQDLSVAGRRAGLDGERSGLFWHQCRVARMVAARWVLWENVPGILSSNDGEDFAAVLWGLTGFRPAVPPDGWRTVGVCVGPERTAVWRVLDARWFGVAQRRRRVFVVTDSGGDGGLEVLLERESVPRNSRPQSPAEQDVAGSLGGSTPRGGPRSDTDRMTFVPVSFAWQNGGGCGDDDEGLAITTDGCSPLNTSQTPAVAFAENQRAEIITSDYAHQLTAGGGKPGQGYPAVFATAVRRLTPRECERLMGWPDDHTRWTADGVEIVDSNRYRVIGNGVVAPVAEWIGRRFP